MSQQSQIKPVVEQTSSRTGNALVATLIISVTVGLALNLSSDRLQGLDKISRLDEGRQQARLAAESIGTVIEGKLQLKFGGDSNTFTKKIDEYKPGWALGFPGYAGPSGADTEGLWFGNCLVRWRIEPVKVWSQTIANETDIPKGGQYALNPNSDIQNLENDSKYKDLVANDPEFLAQNENNYMYRIVTDAYYMGGEHAYGAKPWLNGGAFCRAQAVRVVQYTLTSLFEYTIFYAATGPVGDLEFWQGTGMAVKGRVHSNGAIYIGGGGTGQNSGDYHGAASNNGGLSIGGATAADQSTVTAVDGIFRMRKPVNYVATAKGVSGANYKPELISKSSNGSSTDLNGDTPGDTRHTINGVAFTSANDSRSTDRLMGDFNKRVRDKWTGASIVTSLANAPDFGGFPFEAQRVGSSDQYLYADNSQAPPGPNSIGNIPGSPVVVSLSQTNPVFGGRGAMFYYRFDYSLPANLNVPVQTTFDPNQSFNPANPLNAAVRATNLPLYVQVPGEDAVDVNIPAGAVTTPAGFSSAEALGPLLAKNMVLDNNRTGLIIRERPAQLLPYPAHPGALPNTPSALQLQSLSNYLQSQYVVLFNQQDITADFFGDLTRTAPVPNLPVCARSADAIASEDLIVNRREANFMQSFFGSALGWDATNFSGTNTFNPATGLGVNHQYRVNVLTLNLRRVQDFLAYRKFKDMASVPAWSTDDRYLKTGFNGVIYAHRTRRSLTYHPLDRPQLVFNPNVNVPANTLTPQRAYAAPGRLSAMTGITSPTLAVYPNRIREGHGPIETFHCAVRIRGGLVSDGTERDARAAVNWAHDTDNDGSMDKCPLGTSKTTIISPNPIYLWGDLNTVSYSDGKKPQRTPVAVFGDAANLLSAAWQDSSVPLYTSAIPSATHTSYVTSLVINNIPCFNWNAMAEGTGAVANLCRFLEKWGSGSNPGGAWPNPLGMSRPPTYGGQVVYTFMGSLVVMNQQRYSRGVLGAGTSTLNNTSFYEPPFRNLAYNSDLKLKDGLPPEAPNGVEPIRVVSTVNIFDY